MSDDAMELPRVRAAHIEHRALLTPLRSYLTSRLISARDTYWKAPEGNVVYLVKFYFHVAVDSMVGHFPCYTQRCKSCGSQHA